MVYLNDELQGALMSDKRPEFLNCIMTPEIIREIRARQEAWDKEHEDQD